MGDDPIPNKIDGLERLGDAVLEDFEIPERQVVDERVALEHAYRDLYIDDPDFMLQGLDLGSKRTRFG
jgi:hypothetical protein